MISTVKLVRRARRHGARHAWKIVTEARRASIHVQDAFALVEGESNFRNIFGHDAGGPFPGQRVTKAKVKMLVAHIDRGGISNGVGLTQLTYPPYIRQAEKIGGAHRERNQLRIAFYVLGQLQRDHGRRGGFRRYNGSGRAAEVYADRMMSRAANWKTRLKPNA